jgi:hypothetical protein
MFSIKTKIINNFLKFLYVKIHKNILNYIVLVIDFKNAFTHLYK